MFDPKQKPIALVILDGWGNLLPSANDPIHLARTPVYDRVRGEFPGTRLLGSTSFEAGHLSIGTGRRLRTDQERIIESARNGELLNNEILKAVYSRASDNSSTVHLIGLISEEIGDAAAETLTALLKTAREHNIPFVNIHCILDGRDKAGTAPAQIVRLQNLISEIGIGRIASICGRFYAMDTGGNWERTARAVTMLLHGDGNIVADAEAAVSNALSRGISEEFLAPMIVADDGKLSSTIGNGEAVIFFNHKPDGLRQLAMSLASSENHSDVEIVCLTDYEINSGSNVIFPKEGQSNVLTQVTSVAGIPVCRVTEYERTNHITALFDGGTASSNCRERHFNIPSLTPRRIGTHPEAASFRIADRVRDELAAFPGLFIVNIPATALAERTGQMENIIEAIQFVDTCLGGILDPLLQADGMAIITSSHGITGESELPFHLVGNDMEDVRLRDGGTLEDVAPTLLSLIGIEPPDQMTGTDLRVT
jgi:2,3-bisphosphoglycerate-independent phosphoglycerate mutase